MVSTHLKNICQIASFPPSRGKKTIFETTTQIFMANQPAPPNVPPSEIRVDSMIYYDMTVVQKVCSQNRSDNAFTCVTPLLLIKKHTLSDNILYQSKGSHTSWISFQRVSKKAPLLGLLKNQGAQIFYQLSAPTPGNPYGDVAPVPESAEPK